LNVLHVWIIPLTPPRLTPWVDVMVERVLRREDPFSSDRSFSTRAYAGCHISQFTPSGPRRPGFPPPHDKGLENNFSEGLIIQMSRYLGLGEVPRPTPYSQMFPLPSTISEALRGYVPRLRLVRFSFHALRLLRFFLLRDAPFRRPPPHLQYSFRSLPFLTLMLPLSSCFLRLPCRQDSPPLPLSASDPQKEVVRN